jgi:hypothetical protein
MTHGSHCPDCAGGALRADGRCGKCDGTGINTQLNSIQPKCPYCHGTGICATCNGTGSTGGGPDDGIITLDLG